MQIRLFQGVSEWLSVLQKVNGARASEAFGVKSVSCSMFLNPVGLYSESLTSLIFAIVCVVSPNYS